MNDEKRIHAAYPVYDSDGRYSKFAGVSACSLLRNTAAPVTLHLLHNRAFPEESRQKFRELTDRCGQEIRFYDMDARFPGEMAALRQEVPAVALDEGRVGMFYRLFLTALLPPEVHRCLYLDADTVVALDIAELWREATGESGLAAVPESAMSYGAGYTARSGAKKYICDAGLVRYEDYFNAGVLLLDLDRLRQQPRLFPAGIAFLREHPQCEFLDQDILNYLFAGKYHKLPERYNTLVDQEVLVRRRNETGPRIYHYASRILGVDLGNAYNALFFRYFCRSPWCDEDSFRRIFDAAGLAQRRAQMAAQQVLRLMAGKERAFFSRRQNEAALSRLFGRRRQELFLTADDADSLDRLQAAMREGDGARFFLLFVSSYEAVASLLTAAGFTEGEDFLDGMELLAEEQGGYLRGDLFIRQL